MKAITRNLRKSIRCLSQQIGVWNSTTKKICFDYLSFLYEIQLNQTLSSNGIMWLLQMSAEWHWRKPGHQVHQTYTCVTFLCGGYLKDRMFQKHLYTICYLNIAIQSEIECVSTATLTKFLLSFIVCCTKFVSFYDITLNLFWFKKSFCQVNRKVWKMSCCMFTSRNNYQFWSFS